MTTRGEQIAESIRSYLFTNGLKKSKLTGALVAEIADRTLDHLDRLAKKKKRLATEEDWIKELEAEPHLAGVNVRKELAACQFWCKNNGPVLCTRKRFINWLGKSVRSVVVSPGGAKPVNGNNGTAPAGWLKKLNDLYPGSTVAHGGTFEIKKETDYEWNQLPMEIRVEIKKALS